MRLQIAFWGGRCEIKGSKENVVKRIMRCVDVFKGTAVLLCVELSERREGDTFFLAYGGEGVRERTIKEIIEECGKEIEKRNL